MWDGKSYVRKWEAKQCQRRDYLSCLLLFIYYILLMVVSHGMEQWNYFHVSWEFRVRVLGSEQVLYTVRFLQLRKACQKPPRFSARRGFTMRFLSRVNAMHCCCSLAVKIRIPKFPLWYHLAQMFFFSTGCMISSWSLLCCFLCLLLTFKIMVGEADYRRQNTISSRWKDWLRGIWETGWAPDYQWSWTLGERLAFKANGWHPQAVVKSVVPLDYVVNKDPYEALLGCLCNQEV